MGAAPLVHSHEYRPKILALECEVVVVTRRVLGVRHPLKHADADEFCQSLLKDVARDAETLAEVLEPALPVRKPPPV